MKKKTKGFTLIELLAIIVILAIIAVITVPIILNVIDNAKKGSAKDSAYGYKDAINKYYVSSMLEEEKITLNQTYNVSDGKLGENDIPFSGTKPTNGYLTYENNKLTTGCLTIDEYKVTFKDGEVENIAKGQCELIPEQPVKPEMPEITYKCKRAAVETLHTEECKQTDSTYYCSGAGHTTGNKGTTITYGNTTVTQGTLTSGDAFDCDVDGDGEYEETERFYYVSDLYNAYSNDYNSEYAVLIYYSNVYKGQVNNTSSSKIAYDTENRNYMGPVTAKTNLPTTLQWTNVSLANTTRKIVNNGSSASTSGFDYIENFSYTKQENGNTIAYAARLLTHQEMSKACTYSDQIPAGNRVSYGVDPDILTKCDYLMENTEYSDSSSEIRGYWLESPYFRTDLVWNVASSLNIGYSTANSTYVGVRPVIEVLKTDIQY